MEYRIFAIVALTLIAGCDFTKKRGPEDVKVQGNSAIWTVETGGAINYAAFVTRERIPAGTKLRIEVEAIGSEGDLELSLWDNPTSQSVQRWNRDSLAPSQILDLDLKVSSRYALDVGGVNFWKEPRIIADEAEGTVLSFDSGWQLKVKLIPKSF